MINGDLISRLQQAALYLNDNGRITEATELEDLAKQLQCSNITKQEFEEIKKRIISPDDYMLSKNHETIGSHHYYPTTVFWAD